MRKKKLQKIKIDEGHLLIKSGNYLTTSLNLFFTFS